MQPVSRLAIAGLMLAVGTTGLPAIPAFTISGAWADPPGDRGHGREDHDRGHDDHDRGPPRGEYERHEQARAEHERHERHFQDRDRVAVHSYFVDYYGHGGHCPPGLARRGDACVAPGPRVWVVGSPLPPAVVTYELPPQLVVQLTPPPVGYKYVRVASDILMVAAGTGMVAAAMEDLAR